MRTTVTLSNDVAAAVQRLRRTHGVGVSEAINQLARRGLREPQTGERRFVQQTSPMGARMDLDDVADVLESIDGPAAK